MHRYRFILFLLCALITPRLAQANDLVVSNNAIICIFGDSFMQSDAAAGMVTGYRFPDYLESYFQLNYPGANIHVYSISRAGGNMGDILTNRLPTLGIPLWAHLFNNFQHIAIVQPTDNGSLTSNQMFLSMSNFSLAPALMMDTSSNWIASPGWCATNTVLMICIGDPPGADTNGGFLTIKARNDAAVNAGNLFGIRGVDSYNILSNSWVPDWNFNAGRNIQFVFPSGIEHFLAGGGLSWCISFLRGITTDTNIATSTVTWAGAITATNHCVVFNVTQSGGILSFQRLDDRLPMAYDFPDGTITNDASPAFLLNPSDADFFRFTIQVTGLPAGTYRVAIDGVTVSHLPSTVLAAGWNMFTNTVGPLWDQRKEVLGRIRDKEHIDRVSLVPKSTDGHGMFSFFSNGSNTNRGDALITALATPVADIFSLDALTATAATPTNHTFTITLEQPLFAPFRISEKGIIQRPDLLWVWNPPIGYVPDVYELQIATDILQYRAPLVGTWQFPGQTVWTNHTNYPVYFADAPQRFARVRAWFGIEPGDWATTATSN
jgi:hypothetical protein